MKRYVWVRWTSPDVGGARSGELAVIHSEIHRSVPRSRAAAASGVMSRSRPASIS